MINQSIDIRSSFGSSDVVNIYNHNNLVSRPVADTGMAGKRYGIHLSKSFRELLEPDEWYLLETM